MCVIADARQAVAVGGVMGGAESEVSLATCDVLIEAAEFDPLSIRTTARQLNLHSPSSYRFERGVDPGGIDWASRRCCELIVQVAGGELADGVIDVAAVRQTPRAPIVLRLSQLERVLGISIDRREVLRILTGLGNQPRRADEQSLEVIPPSWRRDLTREIDLVEEVARIHGYDQIPEDVSVPMAPSHRGDEDRLLTRVRHALTAAGFHEAMTASVISQQWSDAFSPWTDAAPLRCRTPMLRGADHLRRSLIPSLLEARRLNETLGNSIIELFETARVYLPRTGQLPREQWTLGITSGGDFYHLKGVVEAIVGALDGEARLKVESGGPTELLDPVRSCRMSVAGKTVGYMGEVSVSRGKLFGLRAAATVAELDLAALASLAKLVPQYQSQSAYPAIAQDLNLIVDVHVRWSLLESTVRAAAGDVLEQLEYRETYCDPQRDGAGKKRVLFSFALRSADRTLTGDDAESIRQRILSACEEACGARLVG
jgi:phenylalanyl-tRNA synthetase beta chain